MISHLIVLVISTRLKKKHLLFKVGVFRFQYWNLLKVSLDLGNIPKIRSSFQI